MKRSRVRTAVQAVTLGLLALAATSALAQVAPETGYGRPVDISVDGHRSDWLFYVTTFSISVLFVIMVAILLWATIVHRDGGKNKAHYEHGVGSKHLVFTAIISSIIFFGVDGTLLYNSFVDLREGFWHFPAAADSPVEIEVMAQQWAWNIRYPGPDGKFNTADDIVTLNDLHIPANKPVMVRLKSKDVIHSFYLPNFRTKQDAVPGATTQLWFQATKTGVFEIGCAQHCGANHYKMRGLMTVDAPEQFSQWLSDAEMDAKRRYNDADADAHWGWDWES